MNDQERMNTFLERLGSLSGLDERSFQRLMLELAQAGTKPIQFANGDSRSFLGDGDTLKLVAFAENDEFTVGFGESIASVLPANK